MLRFEVENHFLISIYYFHINKSIRLPAYNQLSFGVDTVRRRSHLLCNKF